VSPGVWSTRVVSRSLWKIESAASGNQPSRCDEIDPWYRRWLHAPRWSAVERSCSKDSAGDLLPTATDLRPAPRSEIMPNGSLACPIHL
jgi:hypothetical protein